MQLFTTLFGAPVPDAAALPVAGKDSDTAADDEFVMEFASIDSRWAIGCETLAS